MLIINEYLCFCRIQYVHESGLAIVYGAVVGIIVRLTPWGLEELVSFNSELFYYGLLPPIILNAGYTMDTVSFFKYALFVS